MKNVYLFKRKIEMKSLKSLAKMQVFSPGEINHLQLGSKETSEGEERFNLAISASISFAFIPPRSKENLVP